jgi:hypothetical protein
MLVVDGCWPGPEVAIFQLQGLFLVSVRTHLYGVQVNQSIVDQIHSMCAVLVEI